MTSNSTKAAPNDVNHYISHLYNFEFLLTFTWNSFKCCSLSLIYSCYYVTYYLTLVDYQVITFPCGYDPVIVMEVINLELCFNH